MLFFYKILFVAEILVAEFLFTFRLKKRKYFPLRFAAVCVILAGVAAVYPVNFAAADTFWYSFLMFFALFVLTVPGLYFCYKERIFNLFFCAMAAYTAQHFAYELANLLLSLVIQGRSPLFGMYTEEAVQLGFNLETLFFALGYLICYLLAYTATYFFFARRLKKDSSFRVRSQSVMFLIAAGLLANILFNSILVYNAEADFVSEVVGYFTNMLCCILLLYSQFELLQTSDAERELAFVNRLRRQEREQYELSKENIDLINIKCHDMRHQLREIGISRSMPEEAIREMEKAISMYDSIVKTGNVALDIVLTEKSQQCARARIRLTCIADGAALLFMGEADIYSMFGNALDNAIDAVRELNEQDRIISLKVHRAGDFIAVSVRNPYAGEVLFDESGVPQTTKGSLLYHGFGVRSIMQTAEKYGGNASVTAADGVFSLNILLPASPAEDGGKYVHQVYDDVAMRSASEAVAEQVGVEGSVLLWNDNAALPLAADSGVSVYGINQNKYALLGNGSGAMSLDPKDGSLYNALRNKDLAVNSQLNSTYLQLLGDKTFGRSTWNGDSSTNYECHFKVGEAPWSNVSAVTEQTIDNYGDAAIMVVTRVAGEDYDISEIIEDKAVDGTSNHLELTVEEADVLKNLNELKKAGRIEKIILLLNTANPLQFGALRSEEGIKTYGVDACVWAGLGGTMSYVSVADVLTNSNYILSGRTTDTLLYDNTSAPSYANFGDYTWTEYSDGLPDISSEYGAYYQTHNLKYMVYQEGVYVG